MPEGKKDYIMSNTANTKNETSVVALALGAGLGSGEFKFDFSKVSLENVDQLTAALKASGNSNMTQAHEILVFAIRHYVAHGDYTKIPAIVDAINDGLGKNKHAEAIFYLRKNVPSLMINATTNKRGQVTGYAFSHTKGADKVFLRDRNDAEGNTLLAMPFWKETDDEVKTVTFNFNEELAKLVERAQKMQKRADTAAAEGKTDVIYKVNTSGLDNIQNLVAALKSQKVAEIIKRDNEAKAA